MRCSTWRGNDLTKLNRQVQLWVCPRFKPPTPHLCILYTGREPVYLLSFIPSASCRSNSFTILSPSPLLGAETPQQVQATSDRSRISTKACSPITCVTGCATKSQLNHKIFVGGGGESHDECRLDLKLKGKKGRKSVPRKNDDRKEKKPENAFSSGALPRRHLGKLTGLPFQE